MKIAVCGDIHFSKASSLVHTTGTQFSTRLENCIKSIEWFETIAAQYGCEKEVFLGDFFDKSFLSDEEITALSTINWNNIEKIILTGNHESSVADLRYSTISLFLLGRAGFRVIKQPEIDAALSIGYLPYCAEAYRKPIAETLSDRVKIIFSHNDLKNISYGGIVTTIGYDISDISNNCNICLNGHIHNFGKVSNSIINLGNLTGQNFSEDALVYPHNIAILDTDTLEISFIENPYSFNFYKLNILDASDLDIFNTLKTNAVVSVRCTKQYFEATRDAITRCPNILLNRLVTIVEAVKETETTVSIQDLQVDHRKKFIEFCQANINNDEILNQELLEVCR